jgi:hypothetical protein
LAQRDPPFFIAGLNGWDFQGGGFMESFFRRLHLQGAHPGLSAEGDSTFRTWSCWLVGNCCDEFNHVSDTIAYGQAAGDGRMSRSARRNALKEG